VLELGAYLRDVDTAVVDIDGEGAPMQNVTGGLPPSFK
jgi:hypothetical protein